VQNFLVEKNRRKVSFYLHLYSISNLMKMIRTFRRILLALLILVPLAMFSQPGPPAGGSPPCGPPFGPACPIDGGVSLLIAAGLAYGGKKAYHMGRKKA
jgi:hypothetical protein